MTVKGLWAKVAMAHFPTGDDGKHRWRRKQGTPNLKEFARQLLATKPVGSPEHETARRFLTNKSTRTDAPPKGIGRTRKSKGGGKGGDKKPAEGAQRR